METCFICHKEKETKRVKTTTGSLEQITDLCETCLSETQVYAVRCQLPTTFEILIESKESNA